MLISSLCQWHASEFILVNSERFWVELDGASLHFSQSLILGKVPTRACVVEHGYHSWDKPEQTFLLGFQQ